MQGSPPDDYVKPILAGLHSGLERAAGAVQVAAIVGERGLSRPWIYDPQALLAPWKTELRNTLRGSTHIISPDERELRFRHTPYIRPRGFLPGSMPSVTVGDPSQRPTSSALQGRAIELVQIFARVLSTELFHHTGIKSFLNTAARILIAGLQARDKELIRYGKFELEGHAKFAVRRQIKALVEETPFSIGRALSVASHISRAKEEGASPRGLLILADVTALDDDALTVEIDTNRPRLENPKHICKLLLGADSDQELLPGPRVPVHGFLSDGEEIVGLLDGPPPDRSVIIRFQGESGAIFCRVSDTFCQAARFAGFEYFLTKETPASVVLERVLREGARGGLFECPQTLVEQVKYLAESAQRAHHGCTMVLGESKQAWRSGQRLRRRLDLNSDDNREIAARLSSIDGAINIDYCNRLSAFGGLLDGKEFPEAEDLARGGRYNSASRFTKERDDVAVVVVSADGPVTVFADGQPRSSTEDLQYATLDSNQIAGVSMDIWLAEQSQVL